LSNNVPFEYDKVNFYFIENINTHNYQFILKMKLTGFLAFALLSLSILSYGVSGAAFATSDPNPALAISSDSEIYSSGDTIVVSGLIGDYDPL
jgi:hypothetical protein